MDIIVSQWELKVKVKKLHEKPGTLDCYDKYFARKSRK